MEKISNLLLKLRQCFAPRQGKKGASLALVMIVGALLVIWVMCIMPLMSTTGTVAYDTQEGLLAYLENRSSIEYCKSELIHMAQTEIPSTFAVMVKDDGSGKYFAEHKKSSGIVIGGEAGYNLYVHSPNSNDLDDVPQSNAQGNQVVAICAVQYSSLTNKYSIVISTYNNGIPGMKFNATFTPSGTLKIRPEAYNSGDALPLSDFVLVDGKLGPTTVWNSTITKSNAEKLNFRESMLSIEMESGWDYANSGEYPAVFKTTAHTASAASSEIGDELDLGYLSSSEDWKIPTAVDASATKNPGNIWYDLEGNNIKIYLQGKTELDITNQCKIYVNGTPSSTLPIKIGYYTISVDYVGTDFSSDDRIGKYDESQVNVLPIAGLNLGTVNNVKGMHGKYTIDNIYSIQKIEEVRVPKTDGTEEVTYTVSLGHGKDAEGNALWDENLMYCCINAANPTVVNWKYSNVFTNLNENGTYFFYVCRPASFDASTGKFMAASDVKAAGMIFKPTAINSMSDGKYAIATVSGDTYNFLKTDATGVVSNNTSGSYGFIYSDQELNEFAWTVSGTSFRNNNGKYLNIVKNTVQPNITESSVTHIGTAGVHWFPFSHPCKLHSCNSATWTFKIAAGNNRNLTVTNSGTDFKISDTISDTAKFKEYNCSLNDSSVTIYGTGFLNLNASGFTSTEPANVKLIRIPVAPKASEIIGPSKNHTLNPNSVTYQPEGIALNFSGIPNVTAVYANGQLISAQDTRYALNAGSYEIVIKANQGSYSYYANPGRLTVNKASLGTGLSAETPSLDASDDMVIHVPISGRHVENGGYAWFAYKDSEGYHWFSSEEASYPFRLEYGTYSFAVKETGSVNYEGATSEDVSGSVNAQPISLGDSNRPHFMFTLDTNLDGTHKTSGVTWYKLPEGLNIARIEEYRFTYKSGLGTDRERTYYCGEQIEGMFNVPLYLTKIEIHVSNSNYSKESGKWYKITNRLTVDDVNGHRQSLVKGSSLYFMGNDFSINTHGCRVDLYADLIVLNKGITYGGYSDSDGNPTHGSVYVHPYKDDADKVLIFAVNDIQNTRGQTIFTAKTFYEIPVNELTNDFDINSLTSDTVDPSWICPLSPNSERLQDILRSGRYPLINLDIAYASREQLGRIISSETMGWTEDGVLSGTSSDTNAEYCIPTYVTSISGDASYKANRVLLAAGGTNNSLAVPYGVTFTTRYLSVDAADLTRKDNGSFILRNLGQDDGLIQKLGAIFGVTKSYSKTLQMDFERDTNIVSGSVVVTMPSQICRFKDKTNLFAADLATSKQPLTAEYKPSEIENLFKRQNFLDFQWFKTVKIVDRYIELKPEKEGETSINLGARLKGELDIYTNYLYVDPNITTINMTEGSNDIYINSHESGFTEKEYLGIFKGHTGDSYAGTILYFKNGLIVNYRGGKTVEIAPGFYYIDAKNNGVALSDFNAKAERVAPESLKDIAVYIDPNTGKISDSYIDTGLDDNESVGVGGFSGGTVG